jgi:hypothetical protein
LYPAYFLHPCPAFGAISGEIPLKSNLSRGGSAEEIMIYEGHEEHERKIWISSLAADEESRETVHLATVGAAFGDGNPPPNDAACEHAC